MNRRTPLYDLHRLAGAKLVSFAGWDMPLHYGSQIKEHTQVRQNCGVFDVSHMLITDIGGAGALAGLRRLLAADPGRLDRIGQALYSPLLNDAGGILDDLIVYRIGIDLYRVISNAATRTKINAWFAAQFSDTSIACHERTDLGMLAIQGPKTRGQLECLLPEALRASVKRLAPFQCQISNTWMLACSGYTGEDGFELVLPTEDTPAFWRRLMDADIRPAGLGARDSLRLEAGMNLYGADMNETTTPLEVGLPWTVNWEPPSRDFIGRKALEVQRANGVPFERVGLVFDAHTIPRAGYTIYSNLGNGTITSGGFSPTLNAGIALARIPSGAGKDLWLEVRGKKAIPTLVRPPFVLRGSKAYKPLWAN